MEHDIEKMNFIEVEIPSHRQALGAAWWEGCRRIADRKSNQPISWWGISMKKTTLSIAAILLTVVVGATVVIVALLLFPSGEGEATDNLASNNLMEKALMSVKEFVPEAETLEESQHYGNDLTVAFKVRDDQGEDLGMIVVDKATGRIDLLYTATNSPSATTSSEVNIGLEEAMVIVREFLETQGVSLENYTLEGDPLVCVGMEGPPDNPIPVYSYEFNYRMQVNGLFVDDYEDGNGALTISLSPEDGSIKSYVLPRDSLRLTNVTTDEAKIGKEEAIVIASEEVKSRKIEDGMTPIIQADGIELRYMLIGNSRLVPYWKVTIRYRSDDLANTDIPEEAKYMGGCLYAVSAVDGEVLFDGSY